MKKNAIVHIVIGLLVPFVILAASGVRILKHPTNWQNPEQATIKDEELAFTDKRFKQFKNDGIFFMSRFNAGWVFMTSFIGWSYGPFNQWGIYALVSEPDGTRHWAKHAINKETIKMASDYLYLKGDKNFVEGRGMKYRVHYDFEGFYCDLTYRNVLPPWKPGDGWVFLTPDKKIFNYYLTNCPWADVTGAMKVAGKTLNVVGQGYSDRSLSVMPPTRQNPYLYSIRTFSPDGTPPDKRWFFGLLESISHEEYGSKRLPTLKLAHGNKWVLSTKNYTLTPKDFVKGPDTPYEYPTRLIIHTRDQGYALDGEYRCRKLFDFTDILAELPAWARKAVTKFVKRPVFFRCLGEFNAVLKNPAGDVKRLHLLGPHEYMVVK